MNNLCKNPVARLCANMMLDLHDISHNADITLWDASSDKFVSADTKLNLCVDIQHATSNKIQGWHSSSWLDQDCYVVVECEDLGLNHPHLLFYDFMWNRSKAYYTQRPWNYRPWYLYHTDNFLLQTISQAEEKTRLFLCPNKPSTQFRSQLNDRLAKLDKIGYANCVLESNFVSPEAQRVADITETNRLPRGYSPVHNAYYRETFFSVYIETIDSGTTQLITEKTLDPLIKGHFILPFGAPGFVEYVKSQGWKLPNFINYSYDSIQDDQMRFRAFEQELNRLCSIDLDVWCQLWVDNIDIVKYNRNQLYSRPYHRLEILDEM